MQQRLLLSLCVLVSTKAPWRDTSKSWWKRREEPTPGATPAASASDYCSTSFSDWLVVDCYSFRWGQFAFSPSLISAKCRVGSIIRQLPANLPHHLYPVFLLSLVMCITGTNKKCIKNNRNIDYPTFYQLVHVLACWAKLCIHWIYP